MDAAVMTSRVATIVRCADLALHVHATLESVERQTLRGGVIVLVVDPSTPPTARDWLAAVAAPRRLQVAYCSTTNPGAVRNAGIRLIKSPYVMCIDAGDVVDASYHELASAMLDKTADVGAVTSPVLLLGPGSARRTIAPETREIDALVGSTEAIH